jgi:peptide/nickel transport system permease protein
VTTLDPEVTLPPTVTAGSLLGRLGAALRSEWRRLRRDRLAPIGAVLLIAFVALAAVGPHVAPYDPRAIQVNERGIAKRLQPPSAQHWLGTEATGRDVFSQLLSGTRVAVVVGFVAALLVVFIGTAIGVVSGYFGGPVDTVLMRITDAAFVLPTIPFVVVIAAVSRPSISSTLLAISLLFWRNSARVIRAQVLSLRNRSYIKAARAAGTSDAKILVRHILPSVLPLATFYGAIGVEAAVTTEASLAFLGFGDPSVISWGRMLQAAFDAGAARSAWWWVVPPGLMITLLVWSVYLLRRGYEDLVNPRLRSRA